MPIRPKSNRAVSTSLRRIRIATDIVENPKLAADRIVAFGEIVGRENVIAGNDCGLGGRVHPQFAWAMLSLVPGFS